MLEDYIDPKTQIAEGYGLLSGPRVNSYVASK